MVTTSLLELDVERILRELEKVIEVEFPKDVIEVSLEPRLKLLCIRFKKPSKAEFGEPLRHGVHLFTDKTTNEITAVEVVDWEKVLKIGVVDGLHRIPRKHFRASSREYEKPTDALYGAVKVEKPIDEPKRMAREYMRKKLLDDIQ